MSHAPSPTDPVSPGASPQRDGGPPVGFDRKRYIALQSEHIRERQRRIGGRLYLEMGGKLFDDMHAARVLPGFDPDTKIAMLEELRDELEIVIAVNAHDLQRHKVRADLGITYEEEVLRLVDAFRSRGFVVENVVLTQLDDDDQSGHGFRNRLERLGLRTVRHRTIPGYPTDVARIVGEEGFGRNEAFEPTRDLIVLTAPGPGSGKLATCLSQIYHDHGRGISSGYAKFETFPVWDLPLEHPVNLAYEAATADLDDLNVIDPFHLRAYGEQATSYNRDVEVFPLLTALLERIDGSSPYQSPTDMGVNLVGTCISDDAACRDAAGQEIIRRWFQSRVSEHREGAVEDVSSRVGLVMSRAGIDIGDRIVVGPARELAQRTDAPASAMRLHDGTLITGKTSPLLGCSAAMLLNALKHLAGTDEEEHLLSPESIEPIQTLKTSHLGSRNPRLHTDEVLIALSVSAGSSETSRLALSHLTDLTDTDAHTTTILGSVDEGIFRSLGIRVTSDPQYQRKADLYHKR